MDRSARLPVDPFSGLAALKGLCIGFAPQIRPGDRMRQGLPLLIYYDQAVHGAAKANPCEPLPASGLANIGNARRGDRGGLQPVERKALQDRRLP